MMMSFSKKMMTMIDGTSLGILTMLSTFITLISTPYRKISTDFKCLYTNNVDRFCFLRKF